MSIPTHGPNCKRKYSYVTKCKCCHKRVLSYGCTCGSSILFVIPFEKNEKHYCDIISTEVLEYKKKKKTNKEILDLVMKRNEWNEETIPEEYRDLLNRHLGQFEFDFE